MGMAFMPVLKAFERFFPLTCFLPPRCVVSSSASGTDQVRFFKGACSRPDVAE